VTGVQTCALPIYYVDQTEAAVMHVPSDGSPATLERCDLEYGWRVCLNAKEAIELRSIGKAKEAHERAMQWGGGRELGGA